MYNIFIHGAAHKNNGPAGIGVVITGDRGQPVTEWSHHLGMVTHNTAHYLGLIEALAQAVKRRMTKVAVYTDSKLLLRQVTGQYKVRNRNLQELADKVDTLAGKLSHFEISYVKKEDNKKARQLAEEAAAVPELFSPPPVGSAPVGAPAGTAKEETEPDGAPALPTTPVPEPAPEPPPVQPPAPSPAPHPAPPFGAAPEALEGVSWRVLAFTPRIMLVQFNYKKGAVIPVHRHRQEQAGYVIKGRVKYTLGDKEVVLGPGLGIAIQGNSDHGLEAKLDSIEIVTYAPMRGDLFHK